MNLVEGTIAADGTAFRAREGTFALSLSGAGRPDSLTPGRPVILGIRPEALQLGDAGGSGGEAVIEEIEPLGNETLVSLNSGGTPFTARVEGGAAVRRGESVGLTFPPEALHWFDAAGEARLG